jgi:uncharacterized protein YyaL (SSP411 family)
MASKDVAAILAKEFVIVKLDWDRMPDAKDLVKPSDGKNPGLPWFVFMDGDGKPLIDSIAPKTGNLGFPAKAEEYAYFKTMLDKVKRHLTDDDIAKLMASLEAANKTT